MSSWGWRVLYPALVEVTIGMNDFITAKVTHVAPVLDIVAEVDEDAHVPLVTDEHPNVYSCRCGWIGTVCLDHPRDRWAGCPEQELIRHILPVGQGFEDGYAAGRDDEANDVPT